MRTRLGLLATLAVAAFPAAAAAEPAATGTLGAASPSFTWEGSGSGISDPLGIGLIPCGEAHSCQDILFKLVDGGDLAIAVDSADNVDLNDPTGEFGGLGALQDVDTYLYRSNEAGEPQGDPLSEESATTSGDESFSVAGLQPGFYVLHQEVFLGAEASWTGKADLTNIVPSAAAPAAVVAPATVEPAAATTEPAPAAQPAPAPAEQPKPAAKKKKVSKKKACQKKAKKIKNKKKRKKALKKCAKIKR